MSLAADEMIRRLDLQPHPEGGWFRETFRDSDLTEARARSTCIYYLLKSGESSHWHRVDAVEVWHWYAGGPLALSISPAGETLTTATLGNRLEKGEQPQIIVPAGHWQAAEPLGDFTLVGCTVAPGFEFAGFELAPKGWEPRQS